MVTKRKRGRQRRADYVAGLTSQHRRVLLTGRCFFKLAAPGFYDQDGNLDMSAAEEAWRQCGTKLLEEYTYEHPGCRPWAWWLFDAPEQKRRKLNGPDGGCWAEQPGRERHWSFGAPHAFGGDDFRTAIAYESQPAYLARHGLLSDEELAEMGSSYPDREQLTIGASQ